MRKAFFKGLMRYLKQHPSGLFARIEIQILLVATARGFLKKGECILFSQDPLSTYARYTITCMKTQKDTSQLYPVACRLGRRIRKIVGFTDPEDLKELVILLYRNIGITMTGNIPGTIHVTECYFSAIYSPEQCRLISDMDRGIVAGICEGKSLAFTERLTEGCGHCTANTYKGETR